MFTNSPSQCRAKIALRVPQLLPSARTLCDYESLSMPTISSLQNIQVCQDNICTYVYFICRILALTKCRIDIIIILLNALKPFFSISFLFWVMGYYMNTIFRFSVAAVLISLNRYLHIDAESLGKGLDFDIVSFLVSLQPD